MQTSNSDIVAMQKKTRADDDTSHLPAVKSSLERLDGNLWFFTGQGDRVIVKLDKEQPDVYIAAKYLSFAPGSRVLVLNGQKGYIAIAVAISNPDSQFDVLETNLGNVDIMERNLISNYSVRNIKRITDVDRQYTYDAVVYAVTGYTALSIVSDTLSIGGAKLAMQAPFFLLGNMKNGIERHAEILSQKIGEPQIVARGKGGFRIFEAKRTKAIDQSEVRRIIRFNVLTHTFEVQTRAGLFSKDDLDIGTRFLLETVPVSSFSRLLDVGCGWGAIGIVAATLNQEGSVVMADVDLRATSCSQLNIKTLNLSSRVDVVATSRVHSIGGSFDLILSNPPFHADTRELTVLFEDIRDKLAKHGTFFFVVHESYTKKLSDIARLVFRQLTEVAYNPVINFRIFKVRK